MPDEYTHPEPDQLILDYRDPNTTAGFGGPTLENRPAQKAAGLAIASIAILVLMCVVPFFGGGPSSDFSNAGFFVLTVPCFALTGLAALAFGIVGLRRSGIPNTRGLVSSILGIVVGVLVVPLIGLLCYLFSYVSRL